MQRARAHNYQYEACHRFSVFTFATPTSELGKFDATQVVLLIYRLSVAVAAAAAATVVVKGRNEAAAIPMS